MFKTQKKGHIFSPFPKKQILSSAQPLRPFREPSVPYGDHFEVEKGDIGPENTYFWNESR